MLLTPPSRHYTMPRRFISRADRLLFASIGAWALTTGVLFMLDKTAERSVWLNDLWNVGFVVGGLLTLAFAFDTSSWQLRALSNAVIVVTCVGRGAGLGLAVLRLLGWVRSDVPIAGTSVARSLAGVGVYSMLAFSLFIVWRSRLPDGREPHRDV